MEKVELTGWEITINENGVKMATMNHERFINFLKYNEYLEQQVKLLATLAVSKCEGIEGRGLLQAYFKWHKEMGFVSHKTEDIDEFLSLQ